MTTTLADFSELDGLITPDVGEYLYEAARHVPEDQFIVEIGAWKGKSTCYLSAGRRDGHGGIVVSVDPWSKDVNEWSRYHPSAELKEWRAQVHAMGFDDVAVPRRGKSVDVAEKWHEDDRIGLLYIDGDHARRAVIDDFMYWKPFVVDGALIIFDDYGVSHNPDVAPVVHEFEKMGAIADVRIEANGRIAVARLA